MKIYTINSLIEALKSRASINKVYISKNRKNQKINEIKELCKKSGIIYSFIEEKILKKKYPNSQGVYAEISPIKFFELEEILKDLKKELILILDRIEDEGNLGAIIRSATAVESDCIIISSKNSAPINETTIKTSAGTIFKTRIVKSNNLKKDIEKLKENGFWIIATKKEAYLPYYKFDFKTKIAIIMGNENKGVSPSLIKLSDEVLSIPHSSKVESLNVSTASAIILFEAYRQKTI